MKDGYRGKIKISSGEIREVRYLEEKDWIMIRSLLKKHDNEPNVKHIQEELVSLYRLLERILGREIIDFYKGDIRDKISELPMEKSFRFGDVNRLVGGPWRFQALRSQAFDEIVEEGLMVDRGSGWYRRAEDPRCQCPCGCENKPEPMEDLCHFCLEYHEEYRRPENGEMVSVL